MFHWPDEPYQPAVIRKSILCFQGDFGIKNDKDPGTMFSN